MIDDIKLSIQEAFKELEDLTTGTQDICNFRKSPRFTRKDQKESSWAKSGTSRIAFSKQFDNQDSSGASILGNIASKTTSTPSYTIPKSSRNTFTVPDSAVQVPFYDPNIDASSTTKRARNVEFAGSKSQTHSITLANEKNEPPEWNLIDHTLVDKESKAYSFGKANRSKISKDALKDNQVILYVEKANNLIYEKQPTTIIYKEDTKRILAKTSFSSGYDDNTPPQTIANIPNLNVLSNHARSQGVIIQRENTPVRKRQIKDHSDYGTPGPGTYADGIEKLSSIAATTLVSKTNRDDDLNKVDEKIAVSRVRNTRRQMEIVPGPGTYAIDQSDTVVRTATAPSYNSIFRPAETKLTPQLIRKRYWEDKCNDVRDDRDNLRDVNWGAVTKHRPTVKMVGDEKKGITFKNRNITRKLNAERSMIAMLGPYDVKYDQVEKRPAVGVAMEQEVVAAQKTKLMLDEAGIITANQRREQERAMRDGKFLGPQLQVPWVPNRLHAKVDKEGSDSDSPTEEINGLLENRDRHRKNTKGRGGSKLVDDIERDIENVEETEYTKAFLRSSYSGGIQHKPTIILRQSTSKNDRGIHQRELSEEEKAREYLSTQVHHDWTEALENKYKTVARMDDMVGREEIIVHAKGIIEKREFGVLYPTDGPAPGEYDTDALIRFGVNVKSGVSFKNTIAREDLVGPNGEAPPNNADVSRMLDIDEVVDIDAMAAKEKKMKRVQGVVLYKKDRFDEEKEKEEGYHHLGGSWYEGGMVKDVENLPNTVRYDNMVGRIDESKEVSALGSLLDDDMEGGVLRIEVKDWKPQMEKVPTVQNWKLNEKVPRFDPVKEYPYKTDLDPNTEVGRVRELAMVDMSRQATRWHDGDQDESGILDEELFGDKRLNYENDRKVANDVDNRITKGDNAQSTRERVRATDLSKRKNRNLDLANKTAAPNVDYNVDISAYDKARSDKGVLGWNNQKGRHDDDDDPLEDEREEVIVSQKGPKNNIITAPAWAKIEDVPARPNGSSRDYREEELDLEVNSDHKKSGRVTGRLMKNHIGRNDNMSLKQVNEENLLDEELDLDPVSTTLQDHRSEKVEKWNKKSDPRFSDKNVVSPGNALEGDVLALSPKSSNKTKNKGKVDFGGKHDMKFAKEPSEIWKAREEVIIDLPMQKEAAPNTFTKWSKERDNALDRPSLISVDKSEKLLLSPNTEIKDKSKRSYSWKQSRELADNTGSLITAPDQVVLSPSMINKDRNKQNVQASWHKENQSLEYESTLDSNQELQLSPKLVNKKKSTAFSMKRHDEAIDRPSVLSTNIIPDELIIVPKHVDGEKNKSSFRNSGYEREVVTVLNSQDEELMLSPSQPLGQKNKGSFGNKNSARGTITIQDSQKEELILSPRQPRGELNTQFPTWSKDNEIDRPSVLSRKDELILDIKNPIKPDVFHPKSTNQGDRTYDYDDFLSPPNIAIPDPVMIPPTKSMKTTTSKAPQKSAGAAGAKKVNSDSAKLKTSSVQKNKPVSIIDGQMRRMKI